MNGGRSPYTTSDASTPLKLSPDDEDVPEALYDLTREEWKDGLAEDRRLQAKVRRCFQQFLRKFTPKGQTEPKYPDLLSRMAEERQLHLDVNFSHLQEWSATLALWPAECTTLEQRLAFATAIVMQKH